MEIMKFISLYFIRIKTQFIQVNKSSICIRKMGHDLVLKSILNNGKLKIALPCKIKE